MTKLIALTSALALGCSAGFTQAATLEWPSATCASTLQACINAAAVGDEVAIRTQAVINEDITISRSLRLFASGTAARFGVGRQIGINALGDGDSMTLENLWLSGQVGGLVGSASTAHTQSITLRNMRIDTPAAAGHAVFFSRINTAASAYTITVERSTIVGRSTTLAALRVAAESGLGTPTINVLNNQVTSVYDGVSVGLGTGRTTISGNRIGREEPYRSGPSVFAISVEGSGPGGVTPVAQVFRNVSFNYSSGVYANAITAELDSRVLNNTFARNGGVAMDLRRTSNGGNPAPAHSGRVANNLISGASCGLGFNGNAVTATANYNFYHDVAANTCSGASAGANDRTGTPLFVGGANYRIRQGSPTIDVGNNADQPAVVIIVPVPTPDFDGRSGRVGSTVDIGAFEFSFDTSFVHSSTAGNTTANLTTLQTPPLGLLVSDVLQVGQFGRDLDTTPSVPPNMAAHLGVWYSPTPNRWTIFNQNLLGSIVPPRQFFTLLNIDANANLVHVAPGGTFSTTTLDHPQLNNQPAALPIVTQRFDPDGDNTGTYNNSAIGVWYDIAVSRWKVFNQAPVVGLPATIASGAAFNVMIPNSLFANGSHAFRTTPFGVPVTVVNISHPLLDNRACAHPYVSASYNPNNVYVPANVVLSYNGTTDGRGNWSIERGDGLQIPAGAAFHVYVDPQQSRRCAEEFLLRNGFE